MIDLSTLEAKHGTAAVLRAARQYIKDHKSQKSALLKVQRGKSPKGNNRKSTYLKTRRECDKAFSAMIKRKRTMQCELHYHAKGMGIELPVKCGGSVQLFHLISKSESEALRYDPLNVICACSGANKHESHNRAEWRKILEQLWPETFATLRERMKWPVKRNEAMLRAMIQEFNKR